MAVFKCKMCGGAIDITSGQSVVECAYCGTQQTIPKSTDENIQTMFNRANLLRQKNEFDKAEEIYEKILLADATEAEAYWCVILCKFGIEYVEDPKTFKRVPTCHRTSYDSIIADEYYKLAIQYADAVQKGIYESEAKIIDDIQKEILAISQKEEPYDVFICYKEADENGKRTQDSVIANDIYHQLTQEGFKVFYAAITLEDKLGSAYEPCIFAALNSAKVMLVVGTKEEHFNAVWVKNEWSRYLKLMKNDRSRILIPCYKDMDAYELPEEFAHLQAQDMSKIGFVNDVIRGVKKIIKTEPEVKTVIQEKVISESLNANSTALLKRDFMALEDSEWKKADDFFEQVLNFDAECAEAYLGKLLAELCITKAEKLPDSSRDFENSSNFNKILRFGNKEIVDTVSTSLTKVKERIHTNYMDGLFHEALSVFSNAKTVADFNNAKARFAKISGWNNADEMCEKCKACAEKIIAAEKDSVYSEAVKILNNAEITNDCEKAEALFAKIPGWKDSEAKIEECRNKAKDIIYSEAEKILDTAKVSFYCNKAAEIFAKIPGWRDADARIEECKQKAAELKAEEKRAEKQKKKKFVIVAGVIVTVIVAIISANSISDSIQNKKTYNSAVELMDAGKYIEAYEALIALEDYKDSAEKANSIYTEYKMDKLKIANVGDYVFFGAYEQDNNTSNGKEDVEWLVLDVKDGKALVISKYALDRQQYNTSYTDVTWETCTLRKWLNNDFINSAFTDNEKAMIPTVTVSADKNPYYSTNPGNETQDQVFLLSITEANKYFSSYSARQCKPTEYAVAGGAYVNSSNGNCNWWLRSPGDLQNNAASVNDGGYFGMYSGNVDNNVYAVRPALWIDLNS